MLGSDWRAYRASARLRRRQFRARLKELKPAIFYVGVLTIFVVLYAVTAGYPRYQAYQSAQQRADEVSPPSPADKASERIADYTLVLAVFTAVLAGVATLQLILLFRADKAVERGAGIARRQMLLTGMQTDILEKQRAISRLQFLATHRPKLHVRFVRLKTLRAGSPIVIRVTVANVGATDTTITRIRTDVGIKRWQRINWEPPGIDLQQAQRVDGSPIELAAGERLKFSVSPHSLGRSVTAEEVADISGLRSRLFVLGEIRYSDANGAPREMGFIRWYDAQFGRFNPVPVEWAHSEYEYQD